MKRQSIPKRCKGMDPLFKVRSILPNKVGKFFLFHKARGKDTRRIPITGTSFGIRLYHAFSAGSTQRGRDLIFFVFLATKMSIDIKKETHVNIEHEMIAS